MTGQVCSSTSLEGASWQVAGLRNSPRPVGPAEQHAWTKTEPKKVHINTEEFSFLHRLHLRNTHSIEYLMASTHTKHSNKIKHKHLVSDNNHFDKSPSAVWSGVQEEVLSGRRGSRLTWCWPCERLNKHYATRFVEMSRLYDALFLLHAHTKTHSKCPQKHHGRWYIHLFLYVVGWFNLCI